MLHTYRFFQYVMTYFFYLDLLSLYVLLQYLSNR